MNQLEEFKGRGFERINKHRGKSDFHLTMKNSFLPEKLKNPVPSGERHSLFLIWSERQLYFTLDAIFSINIIFWQILNYSSLPAISFIFDKKNK